MIQYDGYNTIIKEVYAHKQEHVFKYWENLSENEKKHLLDDLSEVNFEKLRSLFILTTEPPRELPTLTPAPYIAQPKNARDYQQLEQARNAGEQMLREGRVAAFVVAGGQGTRLGFDGPKGAFKITPVMQKSLFQIHIEKIRKYSEKYQKDIPLLIMTSHANHTQTVNFLEQNKYFGINQYQVFLFTQNMIPSLDTEGKLILANTHTIFKNPDGHGGCFSALQSSGMLATLKERGITTLSYFQVDNPLVKIIDPEFLGFHLINNSEASSKMIKKAYPEEKVGIFAQNSEGTTSVIEYSDLPEAQMYEKNQAGELTFIAGNIAIHLFELSLIEKVTTDSSFSLPFHVARKKIKSHVEEPALELDGYKFEQFVFDAIPLAHHPAIFETIRELEFAPVKNKTGIDSVETSQQLMSSLHRKWLEQKKIAVPETVETIEISPLKAVTPDDLDATLKLEARKKVYLG